MSATRRRSHRASGWAMSPRQMIVSSARTCWRQVRSRWAFIVATSANHRSKASSLERAAVAEGRVAPACQPPCLSLSPSGRAAPRQRLWGPSRFSFHRTQLPGRAAVNGDAGGLHGPDRSGFDAVRVARCRADRRGRTAERPYWSGQTRNRSVRARGQGPRRSSRGVTQPPCAERLLAGPDARSASQSASNPRGCCRSTEVEFSPHRANVKVNFRARRFSRDRSGRIRPLGTAQCRSKRSAQWRPPAGRPKPTPVARRPVGRARPRRSGRPAVQAHGPSTARTRARPRRCRRTRTRSSASRSPRAGTWLVTSRRLAAAGERYSATTWSEPGAALRCRSMAAPGRAAATARSSCVASLAGAARAVRTRRRAGGVRRGTTITRPEA